MADQKVADSPVPEEPVSSSKKPKSDFIPPGNRTKGSVGVSQRQRLGNRKYQENIHKRGKVPGSTKKKKEGYAVGPVLLAFFLFVVVGSSLFQVIRTAQTAFVP